MRPSLLVRVAILLAVDVVDDRVLGALRTGPGPRAAGRSLGDGHHDPEDPGDEGEHREPQEDQREAQLLQLRAPAGSGPRREGGGDGSSGASGRRSSPLTLRGGVASFDAGGARSSPPVAASGAWEA